MKKVKLIEINYNYEALNKLQDLLYMRRASVKILEQLSDKLEIVSFSFANFTSHKLVNGIRYSVSGKNLNKYVPSYKFHKQVKNQYPDIVLVHGINNYLQIIHLKLLLGANVAVIVQHHAEKPLGFLKTSLLKLSSLFADAYLFTSVKIALGLNINQAKVFEIMEASSEMIKRDKAQSRKALGIPIDKTLYLWVGRLINIKNPLFLLQEFNRFSRENNQVLLYMIFQDSELLDDCKKICKNNPAIVFTGIVDHSLLDQWYNAADFFVSASLYEGSGYALCEAMSCDLVPIIPNIDAFNFITENGYSGISYASNDGDSLFSALQKSLVTDRDEIIKRVQNQFNRKLSNDSIADRLYGIILNLKKR